ncbi:cytochrome c [Ramlibacter sp. G-1-2-2]|uniref:Cytochrome c n=2 Tax=Ramlibacter agri TaxID=2728837 RepID=A0A848GZG7_9BURK|nr:cytochrome c [Ramlibacter agri]NML43965.1 cytochrome c [Ramlibacter agri]
MQGMYHQGHWEPGEGSAMFADGRADRPPPPGSMPTRMGDAAAVSSGHGGHDEVLARMAAENATRLPPVTPVLLQRGQDRYAIYCLPCHSALGDGDGPVVRRGFPAPPSYHQQRLRDAPDRHFYDVISQGYGIMPSYADRVDPQDRWAIVAYVRALQLSQHAPVAELPPAVQAKLAASGAKR